MGKFFPLFSAVIDRRIHSFNRNRACGVDDLQKHLKLSQGPVVEGSDSILADGLNSLSIRCDGSPGHTEDGHHVDTVIELKAADCMNQPTNSSRSVLPVDIPLTNAAMCCVFDRSF